MENYTEQDSIWQSQLPDYYTREQIDKLILLYGLSGLTLPNISSCILNITLEDIDRWNSRVNSSSSSSSAKSSSTSLSASSILLDSTHRFVTDALIETWNNKSSLTTTNVAALIASSGHYTKPSNGIPTSDLASNVRTILNDANSISTTLANGTVGLILRKTSNGYSWLDIVIVPSISSAKAGLILTLDEDKNLVWRTANITTDDTTSTDNENSEDSDSSQSSLESTSTTTQSKTFRFRLSDTTSYNVSDYYYAYNRYQSYIEVGTQTFNLSQYVTNYKFTFDTDAVVKLTIKVGWGWIPTSWSDNATLEYNSSTGILTRTFTMSNDYDVRLNMKRDLSVYPYDFKVTLVKVDDEKYQPHISLPHAIVSQTGETSNIWIDVPLYYQHTSLEKDANAITDSVLDENNYDYFLELGVYTQEGVTEYDLPVSSYMTANNISEDKLYIWAKDTDAKFKLGSLNHNAYGIVDCTRPE